MNKAVIGINKPGLQTTIQDFGRTGFQSFGVPGGGVMDKTAARLANWLVGNQYDNPVIEMTIEGPEIEILGPCLISITGGIMPCTCNDQSVEPYQSYHLQGTSTLKFGKIERGARSYLAVGGEWKIPKWLGSTSALPHAAALQTKESILKKGSQFEIQTGNLDLNRKIPSDLWPEIKSEPRIGIMAGPEFLEFNEYAHRQLFTESHIIEKNSNRMGYRLGTYLETSDRVEIISSGIVPGTIQVTNSGQLIVLMFECQTTGGYPRIANVISDDLDKLAQLKPGDRMSFYLSTLADARQAFKDRQGLLQYLMREG